MSFVLARRRRRNSSPLLFKYSAGDSLAAATFTRASTAAYVDANGIVQTAGSGVARDGHYIGGVRSLLLEGQRTNVAIKSRGTDFGDVAWVAINSPTKTAGNATGIGGVANTAATLSALTANRYAYQALTGLANTQVTVSVWLQGSGTINLILFDNISSFQTSLITLTATLTRYTFTATFGAGATDMRAGIGRVGATPTATSVVWDGFQVEAAAFASSFIQTTTAAVTRSTDALSWPGVASGTYYERWLDENTGVVTDSVSVYSGATITPALNRAYTNIKIASGTQTLATMQGL